MSVTPVKTAANESTTGVKDSRPARARLRVRIRVASPIALLVGTVVLAVYCLASSNSGFADAIAQMALLVALSQSWNLLAGFGGMISLGVAAFAGTGSYTVALIAARLEWSWWLALVITIPVSLVLAALLSVPLLRLRGDYFAIGSLAASLALQAIARNVGVLGGSQGIGLPVDALPYPTTVEVLAIIVAAIAVGFVIFMSQSRFGLRVMAARDSEVAARTVGINIGRNRMILFLIGAVVAGLAGGVMALHDGSVAPDGSFALSWTIFALLMAVVGGVGTTWGPILGVVIVYFVLQRQLQSYAALAAIIEGVLLVLLIRLARRGLWPLIEAAGRSLIAGRKGKDGK